MPDPNVHRQFVDSLLEQESRVSEAQLADFRLELRRKLADASRHERRMRWVAYLMAAVVLLGLWYFLLASLLGPEGFYPLRPLFGLLPGAAGEIAGVVVLAIYLACAICVIPFLLLCGLRYKRNLQQVQQEQIIARLAELQREIGKLQGPSHPHEPLV